MNFLGATVSKSTTMMGASTRKLAQPLYFPIWDSPEHNNERHDVDQEKPSEGQPEFRISALTFAMAIDKPNSQTGPNAEPKPSLRYRNSAL